MPSFDPGATTPYHIFAGEDLTAAQYRAVKLVGGLGYLAVEGDGDAIWGVLQDNPPISRSASVVVQGFCPVLLGASCVENQSMGPLADGTFGPGATTAIVKAAEAGSAGDVVMAWVGQAGVVGGQVTANVEYTKITSTDDDNTLRGAGDWPGGIPPANARLDVQFLPLERERIELHVWNGVFFDQVVPNLKTIVEPSHGLDLTVFEGQRVPIAWFYDGTNSRPPTGIQEVNHFAIRAPDANSLTLRVASDMDGKTYGSCTNAIGALGETMFWDSGTNSHVQAPGDLRLFQVSDTDLELIKWDMEDTRSTVSAANVAQDIDEWEFELTAAVLAGNEIASTSLSQIGGGGELPPFTAWTTSTDITLHAGGNLAARFGTSNADLTGVASVTGIAFNQDLYIGDRIVIRRYRVV